MTITVGAQPISVTIAGSAPGPAGDPGLSIVGLQVDGRGNLVGQLSNGELTAPVALPAGVPGVSIAGVGFDGACLNFSLSNGQNLPPLDITGLFAAGNMLVAENGTVLLTQAGTFLGAVLGE